jgi:hypothetical protein
VNQFAKGYDEMVIRDLCRVQLAESRNIEAPKRLNKAERAIWNDEVEQIKKVKA